MVKESLERGEHLLFDLDVQGADAMKKIFGEEAKVIFIAPPSLQALRERLIGRGSESEETLQKRLEDAVDEMKRSDDYDYKIINDNIDEAYDNFKRLIHEIRKG